jgi:hypothetical protein
MLLGLNYPLFIYRCLIQKFPFAVCVRFPRTTVESDTFSYRTHDANDNLLWFKQLDILPLNETRSQRNMFCIIVSCFFKSN